MTTRPAVTLACSAAACFAWQPEQTALPAKFVLRAGTGTGDVVSQLYAR